MTGKISKLTLTAVLAIGSIAPIASPAGAEENLAPYKMLRSLQFVQDSVILGDHSAAEMQRYLLATVDERLRAVDPVVYDDPRNVDAALIYAMSGGNPETLEYLVSRDIDGRFDNRVADALRKYLSGKGTLVAKTLGNVANEYKDAKIGPYLALVSANAILPKDREAALKFYDLARLGAPGTIIEESALRRSLAIAISSGDVRRGLEYSGRYVRRFLHSPYASQFADLFVLLAVDHFGQLKEDDIVSVLAVMDNERQKEVYLRIARKATIQGKTDLAKLAAHNAEALAGSATDSASPLTAVYGGFSASATEDIGAAMKSIIDTPDDALSPRDRALRDAARVVAEEVLRAPDPISLSQDAMVVHADPAGTEVPIAGAPSAGGPDDPGGAPEAVGAAIQTPAVAEDGEVGAEFSTYVSTGRNKLDEIDNLLNEESDLP